MEHSMNRSRVVIVIGVGLIAVSFASIFIKLCEAPSLVIAAYRLVIASVFYLGFTRMKLGPIWSPLSWSQRKVAFLSGLFLTLHFTTWITSLKFTSIASSAVLVQTAPIFVALGGFIFLKERPSIVVMLGMGITLAGSIVISTHDFSLEAGSIIGNLLAIGGAIGAAGYILAGRKLRASLDTLRYVSVVYSIAAVLLFLSATGSGASLLGYSLRNYLLLIAIAVVPQIIGHTSFNWALKYLSATTISIVLLGEPIGASILAVLILDERLSLIKIVGGLIIISGVTIVLMAEARANTKKLDMLDDEKEKA